MPLWTDIPFQPSSSPEPPFPSSPCPTDKEDTPPFHRPTADLNILCQHAVFYFGRGDLFIRVQGMIYKLHRGIILPSSLYMQSLVEIPESNGQNIRRPLYFNDFPMYEFETLVEFLYAPLIFVYNKEDQMKQLFCIAKRLGYGDIRIIAEHYLH